jgi:hypothetical protein
MSSGAGASDPWKTSQGLIGVIIGSEACVSPEPGWDLRSRCLMLWCVLLSPPARTVLISRCLAKSQSINSNTNSPSLQYFPKYREFHQCQSKRTENCNSARWPAFHFTVSTLYSTTFSSFQLSKNRLDIHWSQTFAHPLVHKSTPHPQWSSGYDFRLSFTPTSRGRPGFGKNRRTPLAFESH